MTQPPAALPAAVPRCRQRDDGSIIVEGLDGIQVTSAERLARDHSAFATRVATSATEAAPGVSVTAETVELSGGRFTNLYELRAARRAARVDPWSAAAGAYLPDLLSGDSTVAAVTGSFCFISDDPEYVPAEPCFDLCVRDGAVRSLPSSDKPALLVQGPAVAVRWLRARGRLTVGGLALCWAGARSASPPALPVRETVEVFGAADCRIRYRANERTRFLRYVSRAENCTGRDAAVVDAVVAWDGTGLAVAEIHPGGGADLFSGAFVLRFRGPRPKALRLGATVRVTEIDGADASTVDAAMSVGPSAADAAAGRTGGYGDCLGNRPFRPDGGHARTLISVRDDEVIVQVFDGAPLTKRFQGPTPAEVREIVAARGGNPGRTFHLDGGGSARMVLPGDGDLLVLGGLYYLRWPERPADAFEWRGRQGRRLNSAILIRSVRPPA